MKKMKLKSLGLNVNDLLTREQLKTIYGGSGSGGSGGCLPPAAYCGKGANNDLPCCSNRCTDAGNGSGTGPGQDKTCD